MGIYKTGRKVYRKYKKGGIRKVAKYGAKRVYNRYSKGGMGQLVKDVGMLKAMVNTEKKYYEGVYSNSFGQTLGNATGAILLDITPTPTQNVAYNGRTGQSLKLVSAQLNIILNNQINQQCDTRIRFEVYYVKGDPKTAAVAISELYDANNLTTIIDYQSNRNPNNFSDYRKICTRYIKYPTGQFSSETTRQRTLKINLKLNHHLRFDKNSVTLVTGQIFILAFAETGNCSPATVTTTVPYVQNNGVSSGFQYNLATRFYYVDN